jgi:hypothetical protein
MLTRLLRSFLRPYIRQAAIVVILLVAQTIGNLYLPNFNADIINNGVEKGDIHYILTTGGVMLAIALAVGITLTEPSVAAEPTAQVGLPRLAGGRAGHRGPWPLPAIRCRTKAW